MMSESAEFEFEVLLRRAQSHNALDLAERTLRDVAREALRVFEDAAPKR